MGIRLPTNTKEDPVSNRGQIRPGSKFGDMLTQLARGSEIIVETGTWRGLGSTLCLYLGLERASQKIYSIELDPTLHNEAKSYYDDSRMIFIHGSLVLPSEVPPCKPKTHKPPSYKESYDHDVKLNTSAPYVLPMIPNQIDLLLLDSGFWSGSVEFDKLWTRTSIIALDDTRTDLDVKNVSTRQRLIKSGWIVVCDEPNDRNGWFIAKRPGLCST